MCATGGVFGNVIGESLQLSALGKAADEFWREIPKHHRGVELDDYFVVMPNHVHGIIILNDTNEDNHGRDVPLNVSTQGPSDVPAQDSRRAFFSRISLAQRSLSVVIRTYKAAVTTWARRNGISDFGWQERFHEHIIRDEEDLRRIREYINNNPVKWSCDEENPELSAH